MEFRNETGLLVYGENCLGYLMNFSGHGIYDATLGKVEVTPEDAEKHNQVFDKMMVEGLDRCKVGEGGNFYIDGLTVKTWLGTILGQATKYRTTYTITRDGKKFQGKILKDEEVGFFKRIS